MQVTDPCNGELDKNPFVYILGYYSPHATTVWCKRNKRATAYSRVLVLEHRLSTEFVSLKLFMKMVILLATGLVEVIPTRGFLIHL